MLGGKLPAEIGAATIIQIQMLMAPFAVFKVTLKLKFELGSV